MKNKDELEGEKKRKLENKTAVRERRRVERRLAER